VATATATVVAVGRDACHACTEPVRERVRGDVRAGDAIRGELRRRTPHSTGSEAYSGVMRRPPA
jgi:hypothetical protein